MRAQDEPMLQDGGGFVTVVNAAGQPINGAAVYLSLHASGANAQATAAPDLTRSPVVSLTATPTAVMADSNGEIVRLGFNYKL